MLRQTATRILLQRQPVAIHRCLCRSIESEATKVHQNEGSKEDKLIYEGILSKKFKIVKYFSLSTSGIGLLLQPMFISKALSSGAVVVGVVGFMGFGIVCSPILLNLIAKRYITELYFNEKERIFTAYYLNFFNRRKSLSFKASDVHIPTVPGMFTTFQVFGKIPLFIDQEVVTDLKAYEHLMGFDKPIPSLFEKFKE
ncbi:transmembrane protein 70-like protein [Leptotrombidium deliense]|uniref:Transmembrane protein 70-like protein n=1 Tax=Leptotrombidium deliense TaxID=299467 RepID=A0A443S5I5_9ACAR|nr:transmembrane protein 70-like protein [Leptotrombidium deliense]